MGWPGWWVNLPTICMLIGFLLEWLVVCKRYWTTGGGFLDASLASALQTLSSVVRTEVHHFRGTHKRELDCRPRPAFPLPGARATCSHVTCPLSLLDIEQHWTHFGIVEGPCTGDR